MPQQRTKELEEELRKAQQRTKDLRAQNRQLKSRLADLQTLHKGYKEATANTQIHLTEKLELLLDRLDGHVSSSSHTTGGGGDGGGGGNGGLGEERGEPLSISSFPSDPPHHFSISETREDIDEGLLAATHESPLTALPSHEQPQQQEQQEQQRQEQEQQQQEQQAS